MCLRAGESLGGEEELGAGEVQRGLLALEGMASAEEGQPGPVPDEDGSLLQLLARQPATAEHLHQVAAEKSA
jgi:hypothetical protein